MFLVKDILMRQDILYRLFLHWHECVREVMHYILCFKVSRVGIVGAQSSPVTPAKFPLASWVPNIFGFLRKSSADIKKPAASVEDTMATDIMKYVSLFANRWVTVSLF